MKYFISLGVILFISGCDFEFDTGSNNYSFEFGRAISYSCMVSNLKSIEGFEISFPSEEKAKITREGVEAILKFDQQEGVLTNYSLSTKTKKHADGYIHGEIKSYIFNACSEQK